MPCGNLPLIGDAFNPACPVAGALVLFPSYHMHAVFPYRCRGERICVAFNARLTLS
jgi:hypothetical protein